jgi:hypothetical protein
LIFAALLVLPALAAVAADPKLSDPQYSPIRSYYDDCNYVARNSSLPEIMRLVGLIQRAEKPQFGLLDIRGRRVFAAIAATQGIVLYIDPGIFGLPVFPIQYTYTTTPLEIISAGKQVASIRVRAQSALPLARPAQPAGSGWLGGLIAPRGSAGPQGSGPVSITQIDEWVLVDGVWRLQFLHFYEI